MPDLLNSASLKSDLSPGTLAMAFGLNLADCWAEGVAQTAPWPTKLCGAELLLAGRPLPISYADPHAILMQITYDAPTNTPIQLIARRGTVLSNPVTSTLKDASPAVFTVNQQGTGQGQILEQSGRIADAANPTT